MRLVLEAYLPRPTASPAATAACRLQRPLVASHDFTKQEIVRQVETTHSVKTVKIATTTSRFMLLNKLNSNRCCNSAAHTSVYHTCTACNFLTARHQFALMKNLARFFMRFNARNRVGIKRKHRRRFKAAKDVLVLLSWIMLAPTPLSCLVGLWQGSIE